MFIVQCPLGVAPPMVTWIHSVRNGLQKSLNDLRNFVIKNNCRREIAFEWRVDPALANKAKQDEKMLGRAVTAFRNSVSKSKSSSTLDGPNDDDCAESVASSFSSASIASSASLKYRHDSSTASTTASTPKSSRMSFLRRQRRSRSTNREGEPPTLICISKFRSRVCNLVGTYTMHHSCTSSVSGEFLRQICFMSHECLGISHLRDKNQFFFCCLCRFACLFQSAFRSMGSIWGMTFCWIINFGGEKSMVKMHTIQVNHIHRLLHCQDDVASLIHFRWFYTMRNIWNEMIHSKLFFVCVVSMRSLDIAFEQTSTRQSSVCQFKDNWHTLSPIKNWHGRNDFLIVFSFDATQTNDWLNDCEQERCGQMDRARVTFKDVRYHINVEPCVCIM